MGVMGLSREVLGLRQRREQSEPLGSRGANGECAQQEESSYAEGLATTDTSALPLCHLL